MQVCSVGDDHSGLPNHTSRAIHEGCKEAENSYEHGKLITRQHPERRKNF